MANKETRIYKNNTLEELRQKSNEISLHLGDNEQFDQLLADKTYEYTASAGDVVFSGNDTSSPAKLARFEISPAHTVDNTGGYIILQGLTATQQGYITNNYTANTLVYQGSSGSPDYQAYIVSASNDKILVRDSLGTFDTTADIKVGVGTVYTITAAKIKRVVTEAYPIGIVRVYKNNNELTQGITPNGFHTLNIKATVAFSGSAPAHFTEGVTVYQGASQTTQAGVEANADFYGTLHSAKNGTLLLKTANGAFDSDDPIRALGAASTITGGNNNGLTAVDNTYGSYIELTTPAAANDTIKIFSLDIVAAINEVQDDIGNIASLTTTDKSDIVSAINEHDSELGTITSGAMATTASTVSGAIREHEDQIGNVDITGIASGNNTITGALDQLHDEVGTLSLNTSADDLTDAINEHEADIGNMTLTGLTATDLSAAIRELRNELGNHLSINDADGYSATTAVGGITELQGDVGKIEDIGTNSQADLVTAITELEKVIRDDSTARSNYDLDSNSHNILSAINEIIGVLKSDNSARTNYGFNTTAHNVIDAINEHEAQIGNHTGFHSISATDNTISKALEQLHTEVGTLSLNTTANNLTAAINEHESDIGNMTLGSNGPVASASNTNISASIRTIDAEIGDTVYTGGDLTTAIKDAQDDIGNMTLTGLSATTLSGAARELRTELGDVTTLNNAGGYSSTNAAAAIVEIQGDIGDVGDLTTSHTATLVGAIGEIESVFDASTYEITAGANAFNVTSGTFTINSSSNINLDTGNNHIVLKDDGNEFGRLTHSGSQLSLRSGSNQEFFVASNTDGTFKNDLTINNNLEVDGTIGGDGNFRIGGTQFSDAKFTITASTGNTQIDGNLEIDGTAGIDGDFRVGETNGTKFSIDSATGNTEIDGTLGVDGDFRVGSSNASEFTVTASNGNVYTQGTLEVDSTSQFDGNVQINADLAIGTNKFNVTAASGNTQIDGTLEVDSNTGIDGNLRVGDNKFNVTASNGNTQIDGVLSVDGNIGTDGNLRVGASGADKFKITGSNGNFFTLGTARVDGHADLNSSVTIDGVTTILNNTGASSSSTGALVVTGGVGVGEDLYVAGDLYVEGTRTELNVTTLEVEDTLILAGNDLTTEPSTGGFGIEVGPIPSTAPSGVASNITGSHSIVYNYATDQWEADGSLILSTATLGVPTVHDFNFGSGKDLSFTAGDGLETEITGTSGNDYVVNYNNTDRGSVAAAALRMFKTVTINGTASDNVVAGSNADTLNLRGLDAITLTSDPNGDTISIDHDNFGTAGTYGNDDDEAVTGSGNGGVYVKKVVTNAQGHITSITTGNFDQRYQAEDPSWQLQANSSAVDSVTNGETVNFVANDGLDVTTGTSGTAGSTVSTLTFGHSTTGGDDISTNLGNGNVIQDLSVTIDDHGHVTATSIGSVNLDNRYIRSFNVKDGNGSNSKAITQGESLNFVQNNTNVGGADGGATINIDFTADTTDTHNLEFSVTNTDKGSSQNIFKTFEVVDSLTGITQDATGSFAAGSNSDTVTFIGGDDININVDDANKTIVVNHVNNAAPSNVTATANTFINSISFDSNGHVSAVGTATERDNYVHPTYDGDDIDIDTGPLTGAYVISDLDFNITTDAIGSVTDANGSIATRELTLGDLGFAGWDLHVSGVKKADVGNGGVANFKDGTKITAAYDNGVKFNHNTFTTGGTQQGPASTNGTVISSFFTDNTGHVRGVATENLNNRFDNYGEWRIQADGDADTSSYGHVDTTEYAKFIGGTNVTTSRSGNNVTINFSDPGYLLTTNEKTATLNAVQNSGSNNNPKIRLNDGVNDDIQIVGGTNVTVTRNSDTKITISSVDNNTDVDVSVSNLVSKLGQMSGTVNIGDATTASNDIVIRGDLTVTGSTTTVNTEEINLADNIIVLNSDLASGSGPTQDAGIEINRGSSENAKFYWDETNHRWKHGIGDSSISYYNISTAPDNADKTTFVIRDEDNVQATITKDEVFGIDGGTHSGGSLIETTMLGTAGTGENHTIKISHKEFEPIVSNASAINLDYNGNSNDSFTTITAITDDNGHITGYTNTQFNMPSGAVPITYDLEVPSGTTKIRLKASDNVNDDVELAASGATTITRNSASKMTISSTNTTYGISCADGGDTTSEKIRLTGSNGTTDDITLAVGTVDPGNEAGLTIARSGDTITFKHANTSNLANVNNTGRTYIQDLQFDTYGHVIGTTSATESDQTSINLAEGADFDINDDGSITSADGDLPTGQKRSGTPQIQYNSTNKGIYFYEPESSGSGYVVQGISQWVNEVGTGNNIESGITLSGPGHFYHAMLNGKHMFIVRDDSSGSSIQQNIQFTKEGNITLSAPNATVDGVDISALKNTVDGLPTPAVKVVTGAPVLDSEISAAEMRTLIGSSGTDTTIAAFEVIDDGNNGKIRLKDTVTPVGGSATTTQRDIGIVAGTRIGVEANANNDTITFSTTAEVNQNTFAKIQSQNGGTNGTLHDSDAKRDTFTINAGSNISITDGTDKITLNATNTTYSADGNYGMALNGTAFRLEDDRRRNSNTADIKSGNTHDYTWYDADVGIKWYTAGAEEMRLTNGGTLHVDGDVVGFSTTVSDERLKENVQVVNNALDKVSQLKGVTFDWKNDGENSAGLIAQDVEKVLPSAVKERELPFRADDGQEYKTVEYSQITSLLVEAIKELKDQNKELRAEIEALKNINN